MKSAVSQQSSCVSLQTSPQSVQEWGCGGSPQGLSPRAPRPAGTKGTGTAWGEGLPPFVSVLGMSRTLTKGHRCAEESQVKCTNTEEKIRCVYGPKVELKVRNKTIPSSILMSPKAMIRNCVTSSLEGLFFLHTSKYSSCFFFLQTHRFWGPVPSGRESWAWVSVPVLASVN